MDQSLSRNMYLETRDIGEMMDIYTTAWKKGLKSTYYLHMKPRHTAEQSTVRVNKAEQMGKRGFAAVMEAAAEAPVADAVAQAEIAQPAAKPFAVVEAVASFASAPVTMASTAEAHAATTPIEAMPVKAEVHVHTHETVAQSSSPAAANAPRIMPPSDPMEQFLCDSCQ